MRRRSVRDVPGIAAVSSGGTLRTYRLAMAATAEYTATNGGSVAGGMATMVTTAAHALKAGDVFKVEEADLVESPVPDRGNESFYVMSIGVATSLGWGE
mgnify:CR=1 FL=1